MWSVISDSFDSKYYIYINKDHLYFNWQKIWGQYIEKKQTYKYCIIKLGTFKLTDFRKNDISVCYFKSK